MSIGGILTDWRLLLDRFASGCRSGACALLVGFRRSPRLAPCLVDSAALCSFHA